MHGIAYYITWTVIVLIYLIAVYMLFHSEKGGLVLLGLLMFASYGVLLIDLARMLLGYLEWFLITEGVGYGTLGSVFVYGAIVWITVLLSIIRKEKKKDNKT